MTGRAARQQVPSTLHVAAAAVVVTALVYAVPWVVFAYPFPGLAIFVATLAAIGAGVLSVLFVLRHRASGSSTDRLIAVACGLIAALEVSLPLLAELVPDSASVAMWARIVGRSFVAAILVVAAWRKERVAPTTPVRLAGWMAAAAGVVVGWTALWVHRLPAAVDRSQSVDALVRTPSVLGIRLAGTLILLVAAVGFARKAHASGDRAFDLLASGTVLMATARFHDFLHPSLHDDWTTTGDIIRVAGYWLMAIGVARQRREASRRRQAEAVEAVRQRVAAEIHDGLAQDLAYIRTQTSLMGDGAMVSGLQLAAEHALDEARRVIDAYGRSDAPASVIDLVDAATREVEGRYGCHVEVEVEVADGASPQVDPRTAHELRRIVGEALANAASHADAPTISVRLHVGARALTAEIRDDGRGMLLDPDSAAGFGVLSMRRRAAHLAGSLDIESAPGRGTRVRIEVPAG